jgi:gluconolactonase
MSIGASPKIIQAEVFATLPDELRGGRHVLEGPSFDLAGNLLCVDILAGRVYRITPEGQWSVISEYDGQPNGLKIHRDGRIFIADRKRGLLVLDAAGGEPEPLVTKPAGDESFLGLNDLVFSDSGDLYFTDQGASGLQNSCGRVFRLGVDNSLSCLIDTVPGPNGLVLNARGNALYIAVTRANCVWRMELDDSERRTGLFVQLPSAGPDGLAIDEEGNLVVAHPTLGGVWVFSKFAEPLFHIRSPAGKLTTNVAYGGPDMRTLFITESYSSSILTATLPAPGRRMFSHR